MVAPTRLRSPTQLGAPNPVLLVARAGIHSTNLEEEIPPPDARDDLRSYPCGDELF
jgi:hypothetical protein